MTLDELMQKRRPAQSDIFVKANEQYATERKQVQERQQQYQAQMHQGVSNLATRDVEIKGEANRAMRKFSQEQIYKNKIQGQQSKYGLAISPTRQERGRQEIESIEPQASTFLPREIEQSPGEAIVTRFGTLPKLDGIRSQVDSSREYYNRIVANAKAEGQTTEQILKTLGDYEQYRARIENPVDALPGYMYFGDRAQATKHMLEEKIGDVTSGKIAADFIRTFAPFGTGKKMMENVQTDDDYKQLSANLQASREGAAKGFRLNMPIVGMFDDVSSAAIAQSNMDKTAEEWNTQIMKNAPATTFSKGRFEPFTAEEINDMLQNDPAAVAGLAEAGIDTSPNSRDMQLLGASAQGQMLGNVAAEMAEDMIVSYVLTGGSGEKVASDITKSLSKGKFFGNHPKLAAYMGKALGNITTDVPVDAAITASKGVIHGDDLKTITDDIAFSTAMNIASSFALPAIGAAFTKGKGLQNAFVDAVGDEQAAKIMRATATEKIAAAQAKETLETSGQKATRKAVGKEVETILDSQRRVTPFSQLDFDAMAENIPESFRDVYKQAVLDQTQSLSRMMPDTFMEDTTVLNNIDMNARASAGRKAMADTINTTVRQQYGDAVADEVLNEMGDALKSDAAFIEYVNKLYLTDGFSNRTVNEINSIKSPKQRRIAQEWLEDTVDPGWVVSDELGDPKGFSDYIKNKYKAVLERSDSILCKAEAAGADTASHIRIMDAAAVAADEAGAVPRGVGAAERGFSDKLDDEVFENIKNSENPVAGVGEKLGDEQVIVNASRATTDVPLDAKFNIGEDGLEREVTGREYIELVKSSGAFPKDIEGIDALSRRLDTKLSHAIMANDVAAQTRLSLEMQALNEAKATLEYQDYLKENGSLSSFLTKLMRQERVVEDEAFLAAISGVERRYIPQTNAAQRKAAQQMLSQPGGEAEVMRRLTDAKLAVSAEDIAAARILQDQKVAAGDYDGAEVIAKAIDENLRQSGRTVQAANFFYDSPTAVLHKTRKIIDEVVGEKGTKALDRFAEKAHRADNEAVRGNAFKAAKELDDEAARAPDVMGDAARKVTSRIKQKVDALNNSSAVLLRRIEHSAKNFGKGGIPSDETILTGRMVNELHAIGKQSLPEIAQKANSMNRWEFAKYVVEHRAEMRSVWEGAQQLAKTKFANDPAMLKTLNLWLQTDLTDRLMLDQTIAPLLQEAMSKQGFRLADFADAGIKGDKIGVFAESVVKQMGLEGEAAERVYRYIYGEMQSEVADYVSKTAAKESLIPSMLRRLQNSVNRVEGAPQKVDTVTTGVVDDIFKIAQRIEGRGKVPDATDTLSKITALGDMVNNQKGYANTWRRVYDEAVELYKNSPEQLRVLKSNFAQEIDNVIPTKTMDRAIQQGMKAKGMTWTKFMDDYYSGTQKDDLVEFIVEKSGATGEGAEALRQALRERIYTGADQKRVATLNRLFKIDDDAAEVKKTAKKFNMIHRNAANSEKLVYRILSGGTEGKYRVALCETLQIPVMTDEKAETLISIAQKIKSEEPGSLSERHAYHELFDTMTKGIPMQKKFAVSALIKTGMLTNPKTHFTNIVSNAFNYVTMQSNDAVAAGFENFLVKIGKIDEADRVFSVAWRHGADGKARKVSIRKCWEEMGIAEYSRTGKHADPRYMAGRRYDQIFPDKNIVYKGLNKYSEKVSNALEKEDIFAAKFVFFQRAGSMMKAKGLTEMTPEVYAEAMKAAKYYTFHTQGKLSDAVNSLKRLPFLGNAIDLGVMPFAGTNLAVLDQAVIDNNPLQIIAGLSHILRQNGGDMTDAIYRTAKGVTGLGAAVLAGVGFYGGFLSVNSNSTLRQSTGSKEYSLNIGPASVDIGDLSPTLISMFQTVSALQQIHENAQAGDEGAEILDGVLKAYFDPAIDASPWGSFKETFVDYGGELNPERAVEQIPASIAGSILPNAVAGIASGLDNTSRSTYNDNAFLNIGSKFLNDFPGYSFTQSAKIDMWGNEVKRSGIDSVGGGILNAVNSTVNPMTTSFNRYDDDELTQEVVRLYRLGYNSAVPSTPSRTITINKQEYRLTQAEYEEFCRDVGQARYNLANGIAHNSGYQTYTDKQKAQELQQRYQNAYNSVKKAWISKLASKLETD